MKLKITKSLRFTILLSAFLALSVFTIQAQNVNDDLKPAAPRKNKQAPKKSAEPVRRKPRTAPPVTPPRQSEPITRRKTRRTSRAKSAVQTPEKKIVIESKTLAELRAEAKTDIESQPDTDEKFDKATEPSEEVEADIESPSDILERFMNFQNTATVTKKDWESVVKQVNDQLKEEPNDSVLKAQLFVAQGELAMLEKDYSNALIRFSAAVLKLPDSSLPHYGMGRVYLLTKQALQAEKSFEEAVDLNKNFALGYKGLGDTYTAMRNVKKAQKYYEKAAKIGLTEQKSVAVDSPLIIPETPDEDSVDAVSEKDSAFKKELEAARKLSVRKKWNESLEKLTTLVEKKETAEAYILIGNNYSGMEKWLSAHQAYKKALELDPDSALATYQDGLVLYELNEYKSAFQAFEKALILDQNGNQINRRTVRKMADRAKEKAEELEKSDKKKKFLGIIGGR